MGQMTNDFKKAVEHAAKHGVAARLTPEYTKRLWEEWNDGDVWGPKLEPVETKTIGQLIDELTILNIRIWMLIDTAEAGSASPDVAQAIQKYNATRNQYVRAIDRRLGERDIGEKVYKGD
jgi:hypothetical protein